MPLKSTRLVKGERIELENKGSTRSTTDHVHSGQETLHQASPVRSNENQNVMLLGGR